MRGTLDPSHRQGQTILWVLPRFLLGGGSDGLPGDQVELRAEMVVQHGAMCQFRVSASVGPRPVAHGDIMLADMPYAT